MAPTFSAIMHDWMLNAPLDLGALFCLHPIEKVGITLDDTAFQYDIIKTRAAGDFNGRINGRISFPVVNNVVNNVETGNFSKSGPGSAPFYDEMIHRERIGRAHNAVD